MILSALGILFVIDDHTGQSIGFLTQIFPYDSFYMPMFVFISGYFYSERNNRTWESVIAFFIRKFRTAIIPFLFWVLFYGVLTTVLQAFDILQIGKTTLVDLIQNLLTSGGSFAFNDSAWFVPLLFGVVIAYCFIRRVFIHHWNDYTSMLIFALWGATAVYLSNTSFRTQNLYMVLKVPFFLQFYHLGVLFRNKLESGFNVCSTLSICGISTIANLLLLAVYGDTINFPLCATMSGFQCSNPFMPLVTSITGIAFWLKISQTAVPVMGDNPIANFISENTAFLMTHHLFIKHFFTGILIVLNNCGFRLFSTVDVQAFRTDAWYLFADYRWCSVACFLFTVSVCVIICALWETAKSYLLNRTPPKANVS